MKSLLCILSLLPIFTYAIQIEPTPKQAIAQKVAFVAYHSGINEDLLVRVAMCESGLNPKALSSTKDFGVMQIHLPLWLDESKKLGYDIYNVIDNIVFAVKIIQRQGIERAYKASSSCWQSPPVFALLGDV